MTTVSIQIDPRFDSKLITDLSLGETIIGALSMPDYYRADIQTPLFSWIVLTNKQLVLIGESATRSFKLNTALKVHRHKDRDGITIIVIKSSWRQCVIRGCFGACEDQLIKILQASTKISAERSLQSTKSHKSSTSLTRLIVALILSLLGLIVTWLAIIKSFLTN